MEEPRDTSRGQWRPTYPPSQKHVCGRQEALEMSEAFLGAREDQKQSRIHVGCDCGPICAHWMVSSEWHRCYWQHHPFHGTEEVGPTEALPWEWRLHPQVCPLQ